MKNVFVGNLSFSTTEDELRAMFESFGSVERVTIVTDRDTGQSRGFAFVEMSNASEADAAMAALDGRDYHGRTLRVNEALPKRDRGFRGGSRPGGRPRGRREPRW